MLKRNVVFFCNNLTTFGGGERWALEVYNLLKSKYKIKMFNPKSTSGEERVPLEQLQKIYNFKKDIVNIDCFSISTSIFGKYKFNFLVPKNPISLIKELKSADIIYTITSNPLLLFSAVLSAKIYNKKLIYGAHNHIFNELFINSNKVSIADKIRIKLYKSIIKQIKYFHVLNNDDAHIVSTFLPNSDKYLIPNFTYFKPGKISTSPHFNVLFLGRLTRHEKGIDLLYQIVEDIVSKEKNCKFIIAGSNGDGEEIVKKMVSNFPKNVNWVGFISGDKLEKLFLESNLLVFPSRIEVMPLSIIEAQSFGLPVVAFNIPGPDRMIKNKENGSLSKPFDIKHFENSILWYFAKWKLNKEAYQIMKKKISSATLDKYSPNKAVLKIQSMFDN